jgi:hypothetical protein
MEKITQDGFAWKILSYHDAIQYFHDGKTIYALHNDESESQIVTRQDLENALDWDDVQIGVEIGFIKTSKI